MTYPRQMIVESIMNAKESLFIYRPSDQWVESEVEKSLYRG